VDSHHFEAETDADPDGDPDSDFLFDADPDPTFHPDANPDTDSSFIKRLEPLKEMLK
jgi:hypothetical protein